MTLELKQHNEITQLQLENQLKKIGINDGDLVMVHSSLRAVGKIKGGGEKGGGETLITALTKVLGENGTLVAYVDFEPTESIPYFDINKSPASKDYGVLVELIRSNPLAVRSKNPGGSMSAIGKDANWMCADHDYQYGYGSNSPLGKIYQKNGKILLLGSDLDQVTILHYAESIANIPNKRVIKYQQEVLIDDKIQSIEIEEYDTSKPILDQMSERYFEEIVKEFIKINNLESSKVGNANSYLLPARELVDFAVRKMEGEFGIKK
jgi:aminoglycoside 3-N-acetyltransferase